MAEKAGNKTPRRKNAKDTNYSMINNTHDHPMIINQMQDPSSVSKIGESKLMDVLTPKSGVREFRGLKTDQSAKSQCESNPRGISTNDSSNLNINKNNSFLKSKVAYDFNPKEFFVHSEKVILPK